jgi:hypothetical protein
VCYGVFFFLKKKKKKKKNLGKENSKIMDWSRTEALEAAPPNTNAARQC